MPIDEALNEINRRLKGPQATTSLVVQSWQRSAASGVDPDSVPEFRSVSPEELATRQSSNRLLLESAIPHLRWLSSWFDGRPCVVYLVDRDGIVLHAEGDAEIIERFCLSPGYDWSEEAMGTNGAGTALACGTPVAVVGCDHWCSSWDQATCLGAPLFDPTGALVGALDVTMDVQPSDADKLVVAAYASHAISQEFAWRTVDQQHTLLNRSIDDQEVALAASGIGMWEVDLQTGDAIWDAHTRQIFGVGLDAPASVAEGFNLIHPDDRSRARERFEQALSTSETYAIEKRIVRPDGEERWVAAVGLPQSEQGDGPGPVRRLIGVVQDITARKRAEKAAEQRGLLEGRERERKVLARDLHDDFSQRLSVIMMRLDELTVTSASSAELGDQLRLVKAEVKQLAKDTRRFSHQLHPSILDQLGLHAALEQCCKDYESASKVVIECSLTDVPNLPKSVELTLYRITQEALQNSMKHGDPKNVRVELKLVGDEIRLTVEDDGAGFDPSRHKPGLGLSSMEERLALYEGALRVRSRPGEGATIEAIVPLGKRLERVD